MAGAQINSLLPLHSSSTHTRVYAKLIGTNSLLETLNQLQTQGKLVGTKQRTPPPLHPPSSPRC